MKFQKCKCSSKLIEIEINCFFLECYWALPTAALCYLCKGLCVITQTLHMWGSFMSSEISSGWKLSAILFLKPLGCSARRGCSPQKHNLQRRGRFLRRAGGRVGHDRPSRCTSREIGDPAQLNSSHPIVKCQLLRAWKSLKSACLLQ